MGPKKTRVTFWSTLSRYYGVQLPFLAIALFLGYGAVAIIWAEAISYIVVALALSLYYWYSTTNGMFDRAVSAVDD